MSYQLHALVGPPRRVSNSNANNSRYSNNGDASNKMSRFKSVIRPKAGLRKILSITLIPLCLLLFIFMMPLGKFVSLLPLPGYERLEDAPNDNVFYYDLSAYKGTATGFKTKERVLFLVPLRDASAHLQMFFDHLDNLTYPHNLIDLAFLVSDSKDNTLGLLNGFLKKAQENPTESKRFGEINIYEKDFGQAIGQGFSDRHGFAAQGPRRKLMARARNWLLSVALRPDHSWVYWRDADVETVPATILEDLMGHNKDVIVPNVWRPLPDWLGNEQPYDLNSWKESETSLQLANQLDEDAVIVEGYVEYATWRPHLAYLRDPYGDPKVEMELDGIGGVSILAKASVFRSGAHFPAFSFQKHAETEGFGKMCKRMGLSVVGLPHYTIWHIYEPSSDDLKHMEWMAQEEQRQKMEQKINELTDKKWREGYVDVSADWEVERDMILRNTDLDDFSMLTQDWYADDSADLAKAESEKGAAAAAAVAAAAQAQGGGIQGGGVA